MARISVRPTQLDKDVARAIARRAHPAGSRGSDMGCRRARTNRSRSYRVAAHPQIKGASFPAKVPMCWYALWQRPSCRMSSKPSSSRSAPTGAPSGPLARHSIFREIVGLVSIRSCPACRRVCHRGAGYSCSEARALQFRGRAMTDPSDLLRLLNSLTGRDHEEGIVRDRL